MLLRKIFTIPMAMAAALAMLQPAWGWERLEELAVPGVRTPTAEEQDSFNYAMAAMIGGRSEKARQLLTPLAERGVTTAQVALASLLRRSAALADRQEALKWSYFAAHGGEWRAQLSVARAYGDGDLVPRDLYQALSWLDRAAAQGGEEVEEAMADLTGEALKAAKEAAAQGNHQRAAQLLTPLGQWGEVEAQERLAALYRDGHVPGGMKQARFWYEKAADNGSRLAQYALATSYLSQSNLSPVQQKKVVELLQRAADPGMAEAQYRLGVLYFSGWGVEKNPQQGEFWYRLAAEQGLPDAQYALGVRYVQGKELPADPYEAHRWFRRAAETGLPKAQHNLALTYLHGIGTDPQPEQAKAWFRRAAANGVTKANAFVREGGDAPMENGVVPQQQAVQTIDVTGGQARVAKPGSRVSPVRGWDWFASLPDKGYTIQVLSSHKAASVDAFLKEYGLADDRYLHYRLRTPKSQWHVVQYGYFASAKEAEAAAARISVNNTRFKPWVRRVGTIKRKFSGS